MDYEKDARAIKLKKYPNIECHYFESSTSRLVVNTVNPSNTVGNCRSIVMENYLMKRKNAEIADVMSNSITTPYTNTSKGLVHEVMHDCESNIDVFINEQNSDHESLLATNHSSDKSSSQCLFNFYDRPFETSNQTTSCSRSIARPALKKRTAAKKCINKNKCGHISANEGLNMLLPNESRQSEKTTYCRPLNSMYNEEFFYNTIQRNARLQKLVRKLAIERQREKQKENWNKYINELKTKHGYNSTDPAKITQYVPNDRNTSDFIRGNYCVHPNWIHSEPTETLVDDFYGGSTNVQPNSCYNYQRDYNNNLHQTQHYESNNYCYPTSSQGSLMMLNNGIIPEHLKKYFRRTRDPFCNRSDYKYKHTGSKIKYGDNAHVVLNQESGYKKQPTSTSMQTDINLHNFNNLGIVNEEISQAGTSTKQATTGTRNKPIAKEKLPIKLQKLRPNYCACKLLQNVDFNEIKLNAIECDCNVLQNIGTKAVSALENKLLELKKEKAFTEYSKTIDKTLQARAAESYEATNKNVNCFYERLHSINSNVEELMKVASTSKCFQKGDSDGNRLLIMNCFCESIMNKYSNVAKLEKVDCTCTCLQNIDSNVVKFTDVERAYECLQNIDRYKIKLNKISPCKCLQYVDKKYITYSCSCKSILHDKYSNRVECACEHVRKVNDKVECVCKFMKKREYGREVACVCKCAQNMDDKDIECACKHSQTIDKAEVKCTCKLHKKVGDTDIECACKLVKNTDDKEVECACKRIEKVDNKKIECACKLIKMAKSKEVQCECKRIQNTADTVEECGCKLTKKATNKEVDCSCKLTQNVKDKKIECACKRTQNLNDKVIECACKLVKKMDDKEVECACKRTQKLNDKVIECACKLVKKMDDKEVECACKRTQNLNDKIIECACKLVKKMDDKEVECACKRKQNVDDKEIDCACQLLKNVSDKKVKCTCKLINKIDCKVECACKRAQNVSHKNIPCACRLLKNIDDKEVECGCKPIKNVDDQEIECACKVIKNKDDKEVECACKRTQGVDDEKVECVCDLIQKISSKDVECACKLMEDIDDAKVECACKKNMNIDYDNIACGCKHVRSICDKEVYCICKHLQSIDNVEIECLSNNLKNIHKIAVKCVCKRLKKTVIIECHEVESVGKHQNTINSNIDNNKEKAACKYLQNIEKFFARLAEVECACNRLQNKNIGKECNCKHCIEVKEAKYNVDSACKHLADINTNKIASPEAIASVCQYLENINNNVVGLKNVICTCEELHLQSGHDDQVRLKDVICVSGPSHQVKIKEEILNEEPEANNFKNLESKLTKLNKRDDTGEQNEKNDVQGPLQSIKTNDHIPLVIKQSSAPIPLNIKKSKALRPLGIKQSSITRPLDTKQINAPAHLESTQNNAILPLASEQKNALNPLDNKQNSFPRSFTTKQNTSPLHLESKKSNAVKGLQNIKNTVPNSKDCLCQSMQDIEYKVVRALEHTTVKPLQSIEHKLDTLMASFNSFVQEMRATECYKTKIRTSSIVSDESNNPLQPVVIKTNSSTSRLQKTDQVFYATELRNTARTDAVSEIDSDLIRFHRNYSRTKIENIIEEEIEKSNKIKKDIKELLQTGYDRQCSVEISFDIPTKDVSTAVNSSSSNNTQNGSDITIEEIKTPIRTKEGGASRMTIAVNTDPLGLLALLRVSGETVKQLLSYMPQLNYYPNLRSLQPLQRSGTANYVCNVCGASFCRPSQLSDHIQQNHDLGRTRDCCICRHVLDMQNDKIGLFKCKYCGKMFARAYCCELHQQTCAKLIGKEHDVAPNLMVLR